MIKFIYSLPRGIARCFSLRNLPWHLVAIALTYTLVTTGIDWNYFLATQGDALQSAFFPAIVIGGLIPIILPACLLAIGGLRKRATGSTSILNAGYVLAQAAIIGSAISSTYKAFTGRVQPDLQDIVTDISGNFNFGWMEHGIFWGWPSSHTTIAFAMAFAFIYIIPQTLNARKRAAAKYAAIIYAFYIGFGVSMSIHWFSEFAAGAIFGTVIGVVVGKSFESKLQSGVE